MSRSKVAKLVGLLPREGGDPWVCKCRILQSKVDFVARWIPACAGMTAGILTALAAVLAFIPLTQSVFWPTASPVVEPRELALTD